MTSRLFEGERRIDALPVGNRGLAYGDGIFETMRAHGGCVVWWDAHWARLETGAQRLRLQLPARRLVEAELDALLQEHGDGVAKLIVTRGGVGRGYAAVRETDPLWVLSAHPLPLPPRAGGLVVRWCETRLATQPALAGIKHCNRLEQVLARAECDDAAIDEGLMRDADGFAVCATAANLFVFREAHWMTPPVERCGVAGVCRAWALHALDARIEQLTVAQVESADAVFLCNAVRGILPVARIGARAWSGHRALDDASLRLADAQPAFADRLETP
ncbi:MAG: aminodeoxychorismate lyase [Luteimonas sp.]